MAAGTTLSALLAMLRAEAKLTQTVSAGLNSDATLRQMLTRTQTQLWHNYDWKHLFVRRDIVSQAGQRYYALAEWAPDVSFERIHAVLTKYSGLWQPIHYGIGESEYNLYDPEIDARNDPQIKWALSEFGIELWPLPASDGTKLRINAVRNLKPLIADGDVCELDDEMLVLFCAAEILTNQKAPDAKAKLEQANNRLTMLKSHTSERKKVNMMGRAHAHTRFINGEDPWRMRVTYARAG